MGAPTAAPKAAPTREPTSEPTGAPRRRRHRRVATAAASRGVTLVELVVVIVVMATLASIGATLIGRVVAGRQEQRARMVLALQADTATGRLADALSGALPNSVRLTANAAGVWIEWVPVLDAGRFRQAPDTVAAGPGDPLDLDDPADAGFDIVGTALPVGAGAGDIVFANAGTPEADAYAGTSRRGGVVVDGGGRHLSFTPAGPLPPATAQARFFVVGTPLTTACVLQPDATYRLVRYAGYGWRTAQPASAAALASATASLQLDALAACSAAYNSALANIGMLTLRLRAGTTEGSAAMALLQQLPVDNTP